MRIPRSIQLSSPFGLVHEFWRCHNKEWYLASPFTKDLYFSCLIESLKDAITRENVVIHAYCAMNNHFHKIINYREHSQWLSRFMRHAHALFGAKYNKLNKRSGSVFEGRPKTSVIQDITYLMRAHFYVEANPIRAGICKVENLRAYIYSSYGYYAYGKQSKYTKLLTPPEWYNSLGKTSSERQMRYRRLFREYLLSMGYKLHNFFEAFVGNSNWVSDQKERVNQATKCRQKNFILFPSQGTDSG